MEHEKAQEFSEKHLRKAREKIRNLHGSRHAVKHVDRGEFYIDAARMVVRCRRLLKYSYAYAHGMAEDESVSVQAREVFEYMQSNLESNTETLSEMSEKPFDKVERESMLNFVAGTKTLLENLRKGIKGGFRRARTRGYCGSATDAGCYPWMREESRLYYSSIKRRISQYFFPS